MSRRSWTQRALVRLSGLGLLVSLAACPARDSDDFFPLVDAEADAAPAAPPRDAAREPRPDNLLRVATYNTRLFFDTVCDSGKCVGGFEKQRSEQELAAHVQRIADAVAILDADVVALQEVENQRCLDALKAELDARQLGYETAVLGEIGTPASIDVAVIARGRLDEVVLHRQIPLIQQDGVETRFARELLETHLQVRDARLVFFAAHFKSKNNDEPLRRLAEASAARDIVLAAAARDPGALVVLGGDLNDTPGSPPLRALEASQGDDQLLRLAADAEQGDQYTHSYMRQPFAIDHLYVPTGTAQHYRAQSARAVRDSPGLGLSGSDHAALQAELWWRP